MNSIILLCGLFVVSCLSASALFYGHLPYRPDPVPDPLVDSCLEKVSHETVYCAFKASDDWHPPADPKSKGACCYYWEIYDCIEDFAQHLCLKNESLALDKFYGELIADKQRVNCTQFPYHSPECVL